MAAVASPPPYTSSASHHEARRVFNRSLVRPATRTLQEWKSPRPLSMPSRHIHVPSADSSDDEDLAPIKLSAEAQAILGEDNPNIVTEKENATADSSRPKRLQTGGIDGEFDAREELSELPNGSPAPRMIRVHTKRPSPRPIVARDGSFMYKIHEKSSATNNNDSKTPAPQLRRIRVSGSRSQTRSPPVSQSKTSSAKHSDFSTNGYLSPEERDPKTTPEDEPAGAGLYTIQRPLRSDEPGLHSTMRVRRVGTGTLLNRPVRRGMIRRHSDDDDGQPDTKLEESKSPEIEYGRRAEEPDLLDVPDDIPISYGSPKHQTKASEQPQMGANVGRLSSPSPTPHFESVQERTSGPSISAKPIMTKSAVSADVQTTSRSTGSNRKPVFKIPSLPPLESANDQENEPPPTFKRSKPSAALLEIREDVDEIQKEQPQLGKPVVTSPSRPALAPRSNNTPHRPAPAPPPKMSLIDAATSNANSRSKKSVHYVLNGRTYRRLDCIGRGGSSRVFRIMAENYKIFALKRVNLEEADDAAIAGYKGEIDLLQKLSSVDRVIRLFDYEVNEEKGVLNVMMELGESDFNKMLNEQLKGENTKLDITFTRHYWKEMLECVQAVHDHDVVHSDLKPANFLLVKGQLKLIDFGIANAIQDNTVNVHRENQIGTPNYMSPESLVCHPTTNTTTANDHLPPGTKLLKLGKPSDVWSLGCILYQMTYGAPPFAHITKQFERIMSIPNPKVEIQFPTTGVGGAVVPFGLIKTLRRCLSRDQRLRPTIPELLSETDPFLNPVSISPEMLGRVIGNVVGYCRKREEALKAQGVLSITGGGADGKDDVESCLPRDEEMRGWPQAFYDKLRQAQAEGTAW